MPRGSGEATATRLGINHNTVSSIWKGLINQGSYAWKKAARVGRKLHYAQHHVIQLVQGVPQEQESTIRDISVATGHLMGTTCRNLKSQQSSAMAAANIVHLDEKWFNADKDHRKVYLTKGEAPEGRACKSKRFLPKVIFLAAVTRPQYDAGGNLVFDGEIGMWPFITKTPAARSSRNRSAGALVTTLVNVNAADQREATTCNIDNKAKHRRSNLRPPKFPELDGQLAAWVEAANTNNVCITGPLIKQMALRLAIVLGISQFRASQGWLFKFQRRHNLWVHRLHGESASVDPSVTNAGCKSLLLETQFYDARDVSNMDETGIIYKAQPKTSMSRKPLFGLKKDKCRIYVALTANVDGSHSMSAQELRLYYHSNRKAWMTIALFSEWIMELNEEMKRRNRTILLLLDQVVRADVGNVRVLMLPRNTTSVLQSMDAVIISTFKMYYKKRQLDHAIQIVDTITGGGFVTDKQRKNPYACDMLQAMRWRGMKYRHLQLEIAGLTLVSYLKCR
ncbi:hypothetical protein H257_13182 [Aphanomyces astaci]|uniref:HTH CENPB-type domain-containing protein n=1 Tax=Aphanomyces astaci TaxID=112090 RepID=W4FXK6_APHAT|nr:hypothetical protein H257_13182 [Aphanomyces astaci]ETV71519.1 hypothetical protein H257_13182 [Aphanomyces astaci]|eukprot:XP_009838952.1 hypothetical protein H257_13182 [Aphanomyces astaci]